jgi:hypothetical protein
MASAYKTEEDTIQKALRVYEERKRENLKVNLKEIAKEFNVSYFKIIRRHQRKPSRANRHRTNQRLDDSQYKALYRYLDYMMDLDLGVSPDDIQHAANHILRLNHTGPNPPTVSSQWPYRFMKQHPEYTQVKRHLLELDRAKAEDPNVIQQCLVFL